MSKIRLIEITLSATFIAAIMYSYDVGTILGEIGDFNPGRASLALVAVFGCFAFAFVRFRLVIALFGFVPPASVMARSFVLGQFSNQFLANVIGQSVSRAALLHRNGVPASVTVLTTWGERLLALALLLFLAIAAAAIFFGDYLLGLVENSTYLLLTALGCGVALIIVFAIAAKRFRTMLRGAWTKQRIGMTLLAVLLTAAAQGMMLLAYMASLWSLGVNPLHTQIAAALLIVMFVSSLPISFAGWGLRELSAAHALALAGVAPSIGISMGVMIGLVSLAALATMAVGLASTAMHRLDRTSVKSSYQSTLGGADAWDGALLWLCALLVSALIFFQIHVPLKSGVINVNAADVVASTAFCVGILSLLLRKAQSPVAKCWIWPGVVAITFLLAFGFVVAVIDHGASNWAITNRGLGWLIVLGYVFAGVAAAKHFGEYGGETILIAFVVTGLAIFTYQVAALVLGLQFFDISNSIVAFPLEGFAANSNAFALQAVFVVSAAIILVLADPGRKWLLVASIALSSLIVFWTWSRTGWLLFLMLLGASIFLFGSVAHIRRLIYFACIAGLFGIGITYLPLATKPSYESQSTRTASVVLRKKDKKGFRKPQNDTERWQTIQEGLSLWQSSPITGSGLGAHMANRIATGEKAIVIHSTPVWILAEFGIIGLLMTTAVAWHWTRNAQRMLTNIHARPYAIGLLILLGTMLVAGLVHDVAYQRIFWFLAALMSATISSKHMQSLGLTDSTGSPSIPKMTRASAEPCAD